ncbi:unnamed protein product [Didymodactylos carnosus]|uniref:Insulin-like domain-containing protein n=1 Tax=Didymodactylos carnosus TaxID=1234261 RepID=A0A813WZG1_9BILA|nr:unnamed protein product [Didymodactylos carnosus]CAF0933888.1 unnamed protein product [Didymodactylos carnosus]CAF3648683.1 unnamed protein product [Didymodactylos carnosus]CAF3709908.1 unnamed protein product [Didymodactylos carnosus]
MYSAHSSAYDRYSTILDSAVLDDDFELYGSASSFNDALQEQQSQDQLETRGISDHPKIDGMYYALKSIGVPYVQRIRNGQCLIDYDDRLLSEGESVQIKGKLYKNEDCLLERAYHACGPNILQMVKIVCRIVDQYLSKITKSIVTRRSAASPKIISESCCRSVCTISELTRYCPQ